MSRFLSKRYSELVPYVPGEQPADPSGVVKLNTNESPFPPSEAALFYAGEHARPYNLYSDPDANELCEVFAKTVGAERDQVLAGNGSDELLNFAFMAFCDDGRPALFPDITYGFYTVFASLNRVPQVRIPLADDFSLNVDDYISRKGTAFIANPNAPTGIALPPSEIEKIAAAKPDDIVVVDEAYADFGAQSCVPLTRKYGNLLVIMTFSKSRSMAGARLGFAIGNKALISDMNTIKYSINPYNVNSYTQALGIGTLLDGDYTKNCIADIITNREYTVKALRGLGFELTDSKANFLFARHPRMNGARLYGKLADRKILVRHFGAERIDDYLRISIGSRSQMEKLIKALAEILAEENAGGGTR